LFCIIQYNIIYIIQSIIKGTKLDKIEILSEVEQFEWDTEKEKINKKKHNITFENAVSVFCDPYAVTQYDAEHSFDEDRYNVIGCSGKGSVVILTVICTLRDNEKTCRIISARRATKKEESTYYDSYKKNRHF